MTFTEKRTKYSAQKICLALILKDVMTELHMVTASKASNMPWLNCLVFTHTVIIQNYIPQTVKGTTNFAPHPTAEFCHLANVAARSQHQCQSTI